jgi:hypothetical protein
MSRNLPDYVADPLRRYLDYLMESMRLVLMSMHGISMITNLPNTLTVLGEESYRSNPPADPVKRREEFEKELAARKQDAEFAQKELDGGFPLLHAHAVVGVWGAFESALEDALVGMLMNEPDLLQKDAFAKFRIPLAQFESLEKEERIRLLVEELERGHGLARKQGIAGFESLLDCVNLSGAVEPEVTRTLWELSNVRNVLIHRASVADRRLVQNCPWMGLKVGDKVVISHTALRTYHDALTEYLTVILRRLCAKYGIDAEAKLRRFSAAESSTS